MVATHAEQRRSSDDSRERLIRLEETLKHIGETLADIKDTLAKQSVLHAADFKESNERISTLETRVNQIYFLGSLITFLGLPTTVYIVNVLVARFGN